MAVLPVSPRHARMLLEVAAWQLGLVGAAAAVDTTPTPTTNSRSIGSGSNVQALQGGGQAGVVGGGVGCGEEGDAFAGVGAWAGLPTAATASTALPLAVALTAALSVEVRGAALC